MAHRYFRPSLFSIVLGLGGLAQGWRTAVHLWGVPSFIGEVLALLAAVTWAILLIGYLTNTIRNFHTASEAFSHPVQGSAGALLAASTFVVSLGTLPYSRLTSEILIAIGICWHLPFSIWHTSNLWRGGRNPLDTSPALYLPTVAGNFTCATAFGAIGHSDWGYLFFGIALFSWLALESPIVQRFWHETPLPAEQRSLIGIQFAPPLVCAASWITLSHDSSSYPILALLGYGFFQFTLVFPLRRWLGVASFNSSYWAYTFGVASATIATLKLAMGGIPAAQTLALPVFIGANLFIGYLTIKTVIRLREKLG